MDFIYVYAMIMFAILSVFLSKFATNNIPGQYSNVSLPVGLIVGVMAMVLAVVATYGRQIRTDLRNVFLIVRNRD